ncbi:MAG: RICIN domain-containing protein [Solirubrobacteraceae bacterium]
MLLATLLALAVAAPEANAAEPLIYTLAGTGDPGYAGDGGPATDARLDLPRGVDVAPDGSVLFAEADNAVIRLVTRKGTIQTVAGTGRTGFGGDGGPATRARLNFVHGVAVLPGGGFLLADLFNARIRRVSRSGVIRTVAGTGAEGFSGDGGRATAARIARPRGVAAEKVAGGGFLIPDTDNRRIRRVRNGIIRTVAGNGRPGARAGDGGPATRARMSGPFALSATRDGGFYIADAGAHVVRFVSRRGRIRTVAGTGRPGFGGDGGQATRARLSSPHGVFAIEDGGFLIADALNHRVRRVLRSGRIVTVAGRGSRGYAGDGGRADRARLNQPKGVATTPDGGIAIADANNDAIRWVAPARTSRLAIALRGQTTVARRGRPIDVKVQATVAAALRITILAPSGQRVRTEAVSAAAGSTTVTFDKGLSPGRRRLLVRARTSDGQVATARATLVVR